MSELDGFVEYLEHRRNIDPQFIYLVRTWVSTYKTDKMLKENKQK